MRLELACCACFLEVLLCSADIQCNTTVSGRSLPRETDCPSECPYWAQVSGSNTCLFRCVQANGCGVQMHGLDPKDHVPDAELKICRSCYMMGCMSCDLDGKRCSVCDDDHELIDGRCKWNRRVHYMIGCGVISLVFLWLLAWYVDLLCCRSAVNRDGLKRGLEFRENSKLGEDPSAEGVPLHMRHRSMQRLPLKTNLAQEQVAGTGFVLHMRFQLLWLAWACILVLAWIIICAAADPQLIWLGWWAANTPRELCYVVTRNSDVDSQKNWVRVLFLSVAYAFTSIFSFYAAVHANNLYKRLDVHVTMGDFVAVCRGLPAIDGTEPVEDELKMLFEQTTGRECIGVSVAWSYFELRREVQELVEDRLVLTNHERHTCAHFQKAMPLKERDNLRWKLFGYLDRILGYHILGAPIERVPLVADKLQNRQAPLRLGRGDEEQGEFEEIVVEDGPVSRLRSMSVMVPKTLKLSRLDFQKSLSSNQQKSTSEEQKKDEALPFEASMSAPTGLKGMPPASERPQLQAAKTFKEVSSNRSNKAAPKGHRKAKGKRKCAKGKGQMEGSNSSPEDTSESNMVQNSTGDTDTGKVEDDDPNGTGEAVIDAAPSNDSEVGKGAELRLSASEDDSIKLISSLKTSKYCFVVFNCESDRDAAVEMSQQQGGFPYRDQTLELRIEESEPEGVNWSGFGLGRARRRRRFIGYCFVILFGLLFWLVCFYMPYTGYVASYDYGTGQKPSGITYYGFVCIIVSANLSMYFLCAISMGQVGFTRASDKEQWYLITYCVTVCLNVLLDVGVTCFMSYSMMKNARASNKDGVIISDLSSWVAIFESYPMQRTLGYQMFLYCFPSTFFLPFVGEGIGAITMPWHVQQLITVSRGDLVGRWAERAMTIFLPMDLGRYADIAINIILTAIMFLLPMGFLFPTLIGLVISHIYIYLYDHYRTLRCTQGFNLGSYKIERTAQMLMALPCGVMLCTVVYKSNCTDAACFNEDVIGALSGGACALHVIVHWLVLRFVVPCISIGKIEYPEMPYAQCAENVACTWFSSNPIYCLRSLDLYKHEIPCSYFIRGKEDSMWASPALGQYFNKRPYNTE